MSNVFLSLGSNLGNRFLTLKKAIKAIGDLENITLIQCSSIYETEPWGLKEQPKFLNMVTLVTTTIAPQLLLKKLQKIESDFGSVRTQKWGSRTLDIDILFYDQKIIEEKNLIIPHPRLELRNFVLIPLLEIAPNFLHPKNGKSIQELACIVKDQCHVRILSQSMMVL